MFALIDTNNITPLTRMQGYVRPGGEEVGSHCIGVFVAAPCVIDLITHVSAFYSLRDATL